jgi:lipopolysaccharide transport system ATP-binding protein
VSRPAIQVEGIGKRYRLDRHGAQGYRSLRDVLTETALKPVSWARSLFSAGKGVSEPAGAYEFFWALQDISLEIAQGEVIGVIGRNGAGKSTLLKVLSRITEPTTGRAIVHGRVGSLLEVGTGFHPELSGRENVFMNGSILGMRRTEIERKFDEIVAFAEVEKFIDTPVKRYSSGMYMRLAFSVAAHLEPEVLFIDEVLAVGDAAFQKKCLGKMGDISRQGRTVLFVSHNLTAVQSLCDRVAWLDRGRLKEFGETRAVAGRYLQTASLSASEQSWATPDEAPGTDKVKLRRIAVVPEVTGDGAGITVETPFRIEVEFWNFASDATLNTAIEVYNIEEVCVFSSYSNPGPYPAGVVRTVCHVPGNFLNNSIYSVRIFVVRDASVQLLCHNSLMFEVHDVERVYAYYGKWMGTVRPILSWKVEVTPADEVLAGVEAFSS